MPQSLSCGTRGLISLKIPSADSVHGESCYTHSISNAGIYSGLGSTLQSENSCLATKIKFKKKVLNCRWYKCSQPRSPKIDILHAAFIFWFWIYPRQSLLADPGSFSNATERAAWPIVVPSSCSAQQRAGGRERRPRALVNWACLIPPVLLITVLCLFVNLAPLLPSFCRELSLSCKYALAGWLWR